MTETIPADAALSDVEGHARVIVTLADDDRARDMKPEDHLSTYQFRPEQVAVTAAWNFRSRGWALDTVSVTGGRRRKDGTVGGQSGARRFGTVRPLGNLPDPHVGMPDWLVGICDAAMTKISEQTGPRSTPPLIVDTDRGTSTLAGL